MLAAGVTLPTGGSVFYAKGGPLEDKGENYDGGVKRLCVIDLIFL